MILANMIYDMIITDKSYFILDERFLKFIIFELMSVDESQEQDCTVYIQQLKSDNPSLKLNAATKISVIGSVLGHSRIKQQLIPYLIEIIEQMDNDIQFLIKVCQGILDLKQFCKNSNQLSALIYPLKVLASLDQPPVRQQAINCLKKLAVGQTKQFYEKHYYPLIKGMANKTGPYSPRIAACCLIPVTYSYLPEAIQNQFKGFFKSFALDENSPLVRRAVAQNIEGFANCVDKKTIRGQFYDIWQSLIVDTFDIIRIKALQCAVVIARAFKKEETTDKFFKLIRFVDSNKKSWRVRYSLVECLVSIINYLEKDIVRKDVVQVFEELLKDQEAEVRAISLIKLPELTAKLSPVQNWSVFFQYIEKASKQANKQAAPTVKLALVESIVSYFKSLQKERIIQSGIPIMATLIKDENQMVRIGIMQRIMDLSQIIGKQNTIKYLIPMIEGCINDKKWRFKLAISQNIVNFFKALNYDQHKDFLQKILSTFFKDHNFVVRQQTIKSFCQIKQSIGAQKYFQLAQRFINQLLNEPNYIYRVTGSIFLMHLKNLEKQQLADIFSTASKRMETEKISNVMVSFFISYSKMKAQLTAPVKKQIQGLINRLKEDKQDQDVLYYASKTQQ